jgi:hypothetical protein
VGTTNQITWTQENLRANTEYTLTVWAEDIEHKVSSKGISQPFQTTGVQTASRFLLKFNQDYIDQDDEKEIRTYVALVLSLNAWRVVSNGTINSAIPGTRRL